MEFENFNKAQWLNTKLGNVIQIIGGGTPKTSIEDYWNGHIPWLSVKDFNNDFRKVFTTEKTITQKGLDNSSTKLLNEGDLIISARGTVGELAILGKPMTFNQSCYGLRANETAKNDFIYYLLKHELVKLKSFAHGSVFDTITTETLKNLEIVLPPLPQQQKIASILGALDDKIELNNQMNQTLETMAKTLFKSWFVDFEPFADGEFEESELGIIPKGWRGGTLGEIIEFINGYAFKSNDLLEDTQPNTFRVFKMGHIKRGGGFDGSKTKSYIEKSKCAKLDKYILKVGDLLMAMTDMKANVAILGHTALMIENDRYVVNQRVGLIRPKNSIGIDYPFLYLLTNSLAFIEDLRSRANSGVQVNLSTTEIKDTKIIVPNKEVNLAFDQTVKPLFLQIAQNQQQIEILSSIRDSLLPKLMSGEIELAEV